MDFDRLAARLAGRVPEPIGMKARYAVLVPLAEVDGRMHLIYEVRAATLRRQPGEICFPGGAAERGEDAVTCALRETSEELGLAPDRVRVMTGLDFLYTRDRALIEPVLGVLDAEAARSVKPCADEVAEAFFVPVDELSSMEPFEYRYEVVPRIPSDFPYERLQLSRDYAWRSGKTAGSAYLWRDKVIWGITGAITRHVLELLREG